MSHRSSPFHWAKVWNEGTGFFTQKDISTLRGERGYAIPIGHGGERCPFEGDSHNVDTLSESAGQPGPTGIPFTVVHTNGIHGTRVHFCSCHDDCPRRTLLLRAGLFPGTTRQPLTAFTFPLLKAYRLLNLQSKCSAEDYLVTLRRLADNLRPDNVSVRFIFFAYSRALRLASEVPDTPFLERNESVAHSTNTENEWNRSQNYNLIHLAI